MTSHFACGDSQLEGPTRIQWTTVTYMDSIGVVRVIRCPSVDTPAFRPERKRNPCGAGQG